VTTQVFRTKTPIGHPAWLVTDYESVRDLLTDPRLALTHDRPGEAPRLSESVIFGRPQPPSPTESEDHLRMRRKLAQWFSKRRLAAFEPRVGELVDGLLDELAAAPRPADFHQIVSFPLPALVICELLGVPYAHRAQFRRWSDDAADMYDEDRSLGGYRALHGYIAGLIEQRLAEPGTDLLSDLARTHREDPDGFTLDDAIQLGLTLLFAGHETTVTAIDNGVVLLATHPEQRDRMAADPALRDAAIEEILRGSVPRMRFFEPPADTDTAGALPRWAKTDVVIGDVTVRAGEMVLLGLAHANVSEAVFPEPGRFDVGRVPNRHLTFGNGPHFCAGAPLARLELQVLFAAVVARFPGLRLAVPADRLEPRTDLLTGGMTSVPVTW
jgi:cytochrome P450